MKKIKYQINKVDEFHLVRPPRLEKNTKKGKLDVINKKKKKGKNKKSVDRRKYLVFKKEFIKNNMIKNLEEEGVMRKKMIKDAMFFVDRVDFVPEDLIDYAHEDEALPIGYEQTISQPSVVAFMLDILEVKIGSHVMDVGFGSCWLTTLLAYLVGTAGHVYAFEIIPELCEFGFSNLKKYPDLEKRVSLFCLDAKEGLHDVQTNYLDRIVVSADVSIVPQKWRDQLSEGGILVYASKNKIIKEVKLQNGEFKREEYSGFVFVPLL